MIDLAHDQLVTFDEAPKLVPCKKKPHRGSVFRWYRTGIGGIHLEAIKISGTMYTTRDAILAFLNATGTNTPTTSKSKPKTSAASRNRAKRVLNRAGV